MFISLFEIHLKEVKEAIIRNKFIKNNCDVVSEFESSIRDISRCNNTKEISDVIAGYYISENVFYYLKKNDNGYFLGKNFFVRTMEINVDKESYKDLENLDFLKFKTFCRIMDYKEGRFDKEDFYK